MYNIYILVLCFIFHYYLSIRKYTTYVPSVCYQHKKKLSLFSFTVITQKMTLCLGYQKSKTTGKELLCSVSHVVSNSSWVKIDGFAI